MGMKKTRTGRFTHIGWFPHYRYEDRDGVTTGTGIDHMVQFVVEVADGPDAGREVRVTMTPAQAVVFIADVEAAKEATQRKEREYEGFAAEEKDDQ